MNALINYQSILRSPFKVILSDKTEASYAEADNHAVVDKQNNLFVGRATLNSDRQRDKAEFGFLITMGESTKSMIQEVQAVGKYKHPLLNREDDRIQIITIQENLDGKRLDLPMSRTIVKSAEAVGDADKQTKLI